MIHAGDDPDRTELLATRTGAAGTGDGATLAAGVRLGRYRIVELLGRGGMGEVYRAEQLEPVRRTVALKLMRGRRLEARHLAYFEVERQLLAQMRHPAIAQVFDADTTPDGQPYFAMEFIAGSPLTTYCEANALPLEARLRLLVGVCEGVQHAHQKGVVHRDLKPGNLLVDEVDGRALPKIIDFGIATAATAVARDPSGGQREVAGTPEYMSPEQALGDQALVDTRSDVYSLGVVLFELLTGQRPAVAGESIAGSTRTLRLPSRHLATLPPDEGARLARAQGMNVPRMRRVLRHELDWVVARAMAHDRADRYPSAAALADDLRLFLAGRALSAVPASRRYTAVKFIRRHRAAVLAASVAVVALTGGLAMSVHGLMQARAQRAIAEERSAQLETVAAFQQSMLEDMDVEAMGSGLAAGLRAQLERAGPEAAAALEEVLFHASTPDLARSLVDGNILLRAEAAIARDFATQPLLDADLGESVAAVRAALGLHAVAAQGYARAAAIRSRELGPGDPGALDARREQAEMLLLGGDPEAAREAIDAAFIHAGKLPADGPLRLRMEHTDAGILASMGDRPESLRRLQALHARAAAAQGDEGAEATSILNSLAILQTRMGDPAAGLVSMERLAAIHERELGRDGSGTIDALHNMGPMLVLTGNVQGAITLQREVVALRSRRLGAEHPATLSSRSNLVSFLSDAGELEESLETGADVIEAMERVLGRADRATLRAKLNRSTTYARAGDYEAALAMQAEVLEARTKLLGPTHPDTLFIAINRAGTLLQSGRPEDSLARIAQLLPPAVEVLGRRHPQLHAAMQIHAEALQELGDHAGAATAFAGLLVIRRDVAGEDHPLTVATAAQLSDALAGAGRTADSEAVWADLVAPLLAAEPDGLAPPLRELADSLRDDAGGR
ncbi:serine/threonine-protein kinase [Luteimonas changyuni]|uniref:serine/threonine-protein kinase n=1 Tax=Luteimonas sp. MJ145 TaxID=3129234 RepID=UPI0031BBAFD5